MKKVVLFIFIILLGNFSFSQREIDNIIQNKTEEGFVEYFKKNGVVEIEGLYLLNGKQIFIDESDREDPFRLTETYFSDLAKVAIVKSGNKFYEYLLKDNEFGDFKNLVGKIVRTYSYDTIARKSKFFDKPKYFKVFKYDGGPYSIFNNITNKLDTDEWLVFDSNDLWDSKTLYKVYLTRNGKGTYRFRDEDEEFIGKFGSKYNNKIEYLRLYPSDFYRTKEDLDIPYFDFDFDSYYYEYADEMKARPQYSSVERTNIRYAGYYKYFAITAKGESQSTYHFVWLNKQNKIVFIEEFNNAANGLDIQQAWDKLIYQYTKKHDFSNKWSDESLLAETRDLWTYFYQLYEFKDLTYKDTPVTLYLGYSGLSGTKYGYRSYEPVGKTYTESEIKSNKQFGSAVSIGKGFMESFKGNKYSLMRALGKETYEKKVESFDYDVGYSMLFLVQDKESPTEYINSFNNLIGFMYPSLLKSVMSQTKVTFTSLDEGVIAIAAGMNKNCESHLLVDIEKWNKSTFEERLFIVFHELAHDLFNLKHSDGIRLMATNKFDVVSNQELGDMIQEMFSYVLNYKDKSTYDCN